jgi:tetratricopeptide (TPR) repeat protein
MGPVKYYEIIIRYGVYPVNGIYTASAAPVVSKKAVKSLTIKRFCPYTVTMPEKLGERIKDLYHRGVEAYDRSNYEEARSILKDLDALNPRMADVLNRLGIMASMAGSLHEAVEYFQRAVNLNPSYTEAALNLTITYNEMGETEKAGEVFQRMSSVQNVEEGQLDPFAAGKLANEHFKIGNIYLEFNRLDEAIHEYRKALELRENLPDVQAKLGTALREKGENEEAVEVLLRAIELNQYYGPAWVELGLAYNALGQRAEARDTWTQALEINSDLREAKTLLKLYGQEE